MRLITVTWPAVEIQQDDTLSRIAKTLTGEGARWPEMLPLNPGLELHPHMIHPGDVYLVPQTWDRDELRKR